METVILARHAESELGVQARVNGDVTVPNSLTPAGEQQARQLSETLADERIDLCVTSEFGRTRRTAELALEGRGVPTLLLPDLNEIRFGRFEGKHISEYQDWAWNSGPLEVCPGGGESRADAIRRYARGCHAILARPERTILVVGHGLVIRYVLDAVSGSDPGPVLDEVPVAKPHYLSRMDLRRAADRLDAWMLTPVWFS